ncbi:hypothetical protein ACQV5M_16705 [Leptospira sp. SA-E8]|uniref:hypothetical protein n=1 Tax=Leptospira sp. SA-E8 TaxID=3422259 RepID=UPI003EC0A33D
MSSGLFGFTFNTLRKRANDPNNGDFWLPQKLRGADSPSKSGKLLPLTANEWDLGAIQGQAGTDLSKTVAGQWWLKKVGMDRKSDPDIEKHEAIPCPESPFPKLSMQEISIFGLDNVFIMDNPLIEKKSSGYSAKLSVEFHHYTDPGKFPGLEPFHLIGKYFFQQCVCSSPFGSSNLGSPKCDTWYPSETISTHGNFNFQFNGIFADVVIEIMILGAGNERKFIAEVREILIRGIDLNTEPELAISELTAESSLKFSLNNIWLPKAKDALTSDSGRKGLFLSLNQTLNLPENLKKISDMLTSQVEEFFDKTLGDVPPGKLTDRRISASENAADQYLLDRIEYSLNHTGSDYYLPDLIRKFSEPKLEPFTIQNIPLEKVEYYGLEFHDIMLNKVVVEGLSHAGIFPGSLIGKETGSEMKLSIPPSFISSENGNQDKLLSVPLSIRAPFSMKAFDGEEDVVIEGSLRINVSQSILQTFIILEGDEVGSLKIGFDLIQIQAELANISLNITLDSTFEDLIEAILNEDGMKQGILDSVNQKLAEQLASVGNFVTEYVKKALLSKLDGVSV